MQILMVIIIIIPLAICAIFVLPGMVRKSRRRKLKRLPLKPEWKSILERNLPIYRHLPKTLQEELHGHIQVFIHEKHYEGCGGLELNDEIRVTIAGAACVLLLNRKATYYPRLDSILVYPAAFIVRNVTNEGGFVMDSAIHLGESWKTGAVILSWNDIVHGAHDPLDGHNVVFHEFAHQLDQEDGVSDGTPVLPRQSRYIAWARVFEKEFESLKENALYGTKSLMDYYGATNPAEFFAVATETFFEKPVQLKERHPDLYEQLREYYRLDPANWPSDGGR